MGQYCDGAVTDRSRRSAVSNASVNSYWCMEMDIYEANGNCGSASTVHTVKGHGGGCDAGGCQVTTHFGSQSFKVHADFGADGTMAVSIGGIMQTPGQDEGSKAVVRNTMTSTGAVIQSSQWTGWVPVAECGTWGDKDSSVFKISNLRVKGKVVAGPTPRKCTGPTPTPTPPTPPTPTPPSPDSDYCLSADDVGFDYNAGGGSIVDGGWTVRGEARIHSKAAFNLLGGFVEFDLDTTGAHTGVNNNLYTISPHVGPGGYQEMGQYCDGAVTRSLRSRNASANNYWCMEMDIYEANGNCGSATTVHTVQGHGGGCDAGGCQVTTHFPSQTFKVHADFHEDGTMVVSIGGRSQAPQTDEA